MGDVLIGFILLVELTIIRQMKLELGCKSDGDLFARKPRCKYWDNLHQLLIPSLLHISKDLIAYFPHNCSLKKMQEKGIAVLWKEENREKNGRDRCSIELEANSPLNLQSISKLWVHNFFPPASSLGCCLGQMACISFLLTKRWAQKQSHLSDLGRKNKRG